EKKIIISNITIPSAIDENIVVTRKNDGGYDARELKVKLLKYNSRYFGVIKNGLFVDGVEAGISPNAMMNMINIYGYDVDFQRDIHSGDKFEMLVESFYDEDGKKVRDGNVLFSSLTLQNRKIEIYMHKISDKVEYFDAKGNSVRKSLLRTPINGARVSSGFGMRRHPILGYSKMHKGVDFAASIGTPILAAGSGTIVYMARKGGYGNYVQIKHNGDYSTAYGHASRFNKKFKNGSKVKQGDVVAYVGNTGRSTGPHLHFELIYRGIQVNPAKVKATSGIKLVGKELVRFESTKNEIDRYRRNTPNQVKKIN
ncbi:MAG: peptidoglycan DD-metalloendopeptidase family protein, partial [Alphaproteobacteria bacterium]